MIRVDSPTDGWQSHLVHDVNSESAQQFAAKLARFREWASEQPRKKLVDDATGRDMESGFHELSGEAVEQLLIRSVRNRDVKYNRIVQYAISLINNQWKRTGQGIIQNDQGDTEDGDHRLLAALISNRPLPTFVLVGVESDVDMFAYLDNGLARTGEDALKIAGINGLSKKLAGVIKSYAIPYEENRLSYTGRDQGLPIRNIDILNFVRAHPDLADAAHIVDEQYSPAAERLGDRKIAIFVGWKIIEMHGQDALEDFFRAVMDDSLGVNHPVAKLRERLELHRIATVSPSGSAKRKAKLTGAQQLALVIKAFNNMQTGKTERRLDPRADDPYPRFEDLENAEVEAVAAQ